MLIHNDEYKTIQSYIIVVK